MSQLLPVAKAWVESWGRQNEIQCQIRLRELDNEKVRDSCSANLEEKDLALERHKFNWTLTLVAVVLVFFLGMAAALILWKNNVRAGGLILSHVGAVAAGVLAGRGWRRPEEGETE